MALIIIGSDANDMNLDLHAPVTVGRPACARGAPPGGSALAVLVHIIDKLNL